MRLNIQRFAEWDEIINNYNTSLNNAQSQLSGLDAEKQQLINDYTANYNNQLAEYENLQNQQKEYIDTWAETQKNTQQAQTDYNVGLINQNKAEAQKQTDAELGDAYVDYQKGLNQFGGNAESMASRGLSGTGFSKNAEISMNITYQNRVGTAKAALTKANAEYDNQIQQALLNNDAALAEIALNQMQQSYQLALQGFEYKNTLYNNKLAYEMDLSDTYFNRKQSLQDDINYYNSQLAEINQYQEEQARWEREFAQQQKEHQDSMTQFWASLNEEKRQFDKQYEKDNYVYDDAGNEYKKEDLSVYSATTNSIDGLNEALGLGKSAKGKIYQADGSYWYYNASLGIYVDITDEVTNHLNKKNTTQTTSKAPAKTNTLNGITGLISNPQYYSWKISGLLK